MNPRSLVAVAPVPFPRSDGKYISESLRLRLRIVAKVDNPDAVHAMLRHLGMLDDPQPDRQGPYREDEPQLELAYDFGA